jgi:hypothetical protein
MRRKSEIKPISPSLRFLLCLRTRLYPRRITIIVEFSPLKERTALLPRSIISMTHPHVLPTVLLLSLHTSQDRRDITLAFRRELGMQRVLVVTVRDIDSFVLGDGMWIDGWSRSDAVFPLFLHLRMHHEQGIVRQMNGNLTLGVCAAIILPLLLRGRVRALFVSRNNLADSKFSSYSKTQAANDGVRTEIGELISVVPHASVCRLVHVYVVRRTKDTHLSAPPS